MELSKNKKPWFYRRVDQLVPHVEKRCSSTIKCNTCPVLSLQGKKDKLKVYQDKTKKLRATKK